MPTRLRPNTSSANTLLTRGTVPRDLPTNSQINSINLGSSNVKLVTGSNDMSIKLWDMQSNEAIQDITRAHDDLVKEVLFTDRSESLLVSAGYDRMVKLWDTRMATPLVASGEHETAVECICFGKTKDQLVAAYGNSCAVWDLRQLFAQGPTLTLRPHLKAILTQAYDHVRERIITGSADSMLKFIDPDVLFPIQYSVEREGTVLDQDGLAANRLRHRRQQFGICAGNERRVDHHPHAADRGGEDGQRDRE